MEKEKIREFTDLIAWQKSHAFVIELYRCTEHFPKNEQFGLTSQMRRSAISITSNIAEGFGRRSDKDKQQFFFIALGSIYEIHSQLLTSKDLGFLTEEAFHKLEKSLLETRRVHLGLINSTHKATFP